MKKIRPIFLLLFLALFLRLILLFPQYSGDVKNHFVWGNALLQNPFGFYSTHFPGFNDANYPPLAIYLFAAANLFLGLIHILIDILNNLFSFFPSFLVPLFNRENMSYGFLKLPGILSDLGIGYLIYKFTLSRHSREGGPMVPEEGDPSLLPLILSSLYLFNPAVIYLSSVWGQIEPITNFFLLLSLYLALQGKTDRVRSSSIIFFVLAALVKQTALWFFPFYLFIWLRQLPWRSFLAGMVVSVCLFFVAYLPFGLTPFAAIQNYWSTLGGSSSGVSDAAWNFWFMLFPEGAEDSVRLGFFSVRQISICLLVVLLSYFIFRLYKKYSRDTFLRYLFFWSLAVFFFQTRVHERHLAPALVFGILALVEDPFWWIGYIGLSLFHFLNLFLTLRLPFI